MLTAGLGAGLLLALLTVSFLVGRLRADRVRTANAAPAHVEPAASIGRGVPPSEPVLDAPTTEQEPDIDFDGGELWRTLLLAAPDSDLSMLEVGAWSGEHPVVGRRLSAAAPIARGLGQALDKATSPAVRAAVKQGKDLYFRFEASADVIDGIRRGLLEVVPARSGGLHSTVRNATTKRFAGAGKYIATGGGAGAAGAAGAALPPLLPVIAVAAVTAALEYAAEAEQRRQLEEIRRIAGEVREQQIRDQISVLDAATAAFDAAAALTLDGGPIPPSVGLDSHAAAVNQAWQDSRRRLAEWRKSLQDLPERPGPDEVAKAFPGIEDADGPFWREVTFLRVRMLLQERVTLLSAAQAASADSANPYPAFRQVVTASAAEIEQASRDLEEFVRGLTAKRVHIGGVVTKGKANQCLAMVDRLHRLAEEISHPRGGSDVPASITPRGTIAVEGVRLADGGVILLGALPQAA